MATSTNDSVMAGPAPGRPVIEPACMPCVTRSSTVALKMELIFSTLPAAAVPVSVKIPEPMTAPTPSAVRLQGPSVLRSRFSGSSEAAISASMLLVRKSWFTDAGGQSPAPDLSLTLALRHLLDFLLHRSARHAGGSLGLGRCFFARRALQFLTFHSIGNVLRVHELVSPAYF